MVDDRTPLAWSRRPQTAVQQPVVREVPYVEIKLEHPGLEPTGQRDKFYPDGVPYGQAPDATVFFWRPVVTAGDPDPPEWIAAVATTHGLAGVEDVPASVPPLVEERASEVAVVVDGTIVGDSQVATIRGHVPPTVRVTDISTDALEISIDGTTHSIPNGTRREISLPDQDVRFADDRTTTAVSPALAVRYPGVRTVHHPAIGTTDRLFPSFGLDLDSLPNPVSVPTQNGELDHVELAAALDVDRADRPYAERVLWQAFALTVFDPHRETTPVIGQPTDDHLTVSAVEGG